MNFDIIEINLVHILEPWAPRYYFSFRETIELLSVAQLSRACFFFVSAHIALINWQWIPRNVLMKKLTKWRGSKQRMFKCLLMKSISRKSRGHKWLPRDYALVNNFDVLQVLRIVSVFFLKKKPKKNWRQD